MQTTLLFLFSLLFISCQPNTEIGDETSPLKIFFVPTENTQGIMNKGKKVSDFLETFMSKRLYEKETGFYLKVSVPTSYVAVMESFGSERADFAVLSTYNYVLLKTIKNYPVEVILTGRGGKNKSLTYKSQIITRVDSGINSLKDLSGKKFAYTDPASTSGHIVPSMMFEKMGIKLGEKVFAGRHDSVVTMVYQGKVDAGATYYNEPIDGKIRDARAKVLTQFPDAIEKVKIIDFSPEIPNSPWVLRTNLYKDSKKYLRVKEALQDGMIAYVKTKEGAELFESLHSITDFVKTNDKMYKQVLNLKAK